MIFLLCAFAFYLSRLRNDSLSRLKEKRMLPPNPYYNFLLPHFPRIEPHMLTNCRNKYTIFQVPSLDGNHSCFFFQFLVFLVFSAQDMQKNDNQFHSCGICQRLFQFFMNNLIVRPFKSITLRHADAEPRSSTAAPVDDSWRNEVDSMVEEQAPLILESTMGEEKLHHQGQERSKDTSSGSEIQVHFKQTEEELEHWTSVDKLDSSVHEPMEGSTRINDGDHPKLKKGDIIPIPLSAKGQLPDDKLCIQRSKKVTEPSLDKEELSLAQVNGVAKGITARRKAQQEAETNVSTMARGRGPNKFVSIQDGKEEDRAKKGKNIVSEDWTIPGKQEPKEVYPRHLISVASNINEKSDAFIQRKKEAMRRNFIVERKKP